MNVTPEQLKLAEALAAAVEKEVETGYRSVDETVMRAKAYPVESQGWRVWLGTMFPFWFSESFSESQAAYWELHWKTLLKLRDNQPVSGSELTRLLLWARGLGKSATLEAARIMRGALLSGGYSLMVSETDDQAQEHLGNCRMLIEHPDSRLVEFYPGMAITDNSDALKGMPTADRKEMFICRNGFILRAKGLTAKMRGLRVGVQRPSDISLDDIDDVNDSVAVSLSKLRLITSSILPVQARENVTIDFGQNLITDHGVASQLYSGRTDALAERTVFGVCNAFEHLDIDSKINDEGKMRHTILPSSVPSWSGLNVAKAQQWLDGSGLEAFLAEYQNEFEHFKAGAVIPEYNEAAQIITWSEFAARIGQRRIPAHWKCKVGFDVGYSEGQHPHWSAWTFIAAAAENSAVPNAIFLYRSRGFKGVSLDDQADAIKAELYPEEMQMVTSWQMSHERTGEMLTLRNKYALPFTKFAHYRAEDGVPQWRHLSRCDHSQPHPFKEDELFEDGTWRLGRPQLFYIVDDDQSVTPADDAGHKLFRDQVSSWNYVKVKVTENGQTAQKPSKVNDDMADAFKCTIVLFGPHATPLTKAEQVEAKLPPLLRSDNIAAAATSTEAERLVVARRYAVSEIETEKAAARASISKFKPVRPRVAIPKR